MTFPTTRLSKLLAAQTSDAEERRRSLASVVAIYWRPVYLHLRAKWGRSSEDAEDMAQTFFEAVAARGFFDAYDPERARFRTFLRMCLDRWASNDIKAARRQKRGGGVRPISLDTGVLERELPLAVADPERAFDDGLYRSLFEAAMPRLRATLQDSGRGGFYEVFERYDLAPPEERPSYGAIGEALGVPATTITNRLAVVRRELRRIVLEELRELTTSDAELDEEARALFGVER